MANLMDWSWIKFDDGTISISMQPPVAIGGWSLQTVVSKRAGGDSNYIVKNAASGYYNVSGMNIVNSGQGVFSVSLQSVDTSGMDYGLFSYNVSRLNSGNRVTLVEGFLTLLP